MPLKKVKPKRSILEELNIKVNTNKLPLYKESQNSIIIVLLISSSNINKSKININV